MYYAPLMIEGLGQKDAAKVRGGVILESDLEWRNEKKLDQLPGCPE